MSLLYRIYYDNGDTYDGPVDSAPELGVVAIVHEDLDQGRVIYQRFDFYCWHPDINEWWGHDIFGLWDYLSSPGWKRVLFGRNIPNDQFRAIINKAELDPDFQPRSARYQWEAQV